MSKYSEIIAEIESVRIKWLEYLKSEIEKRFNGSWNLEQTGHRIVVEKTDEEHVCIRRIDVVNGDLYYYEYDSENDKYLHALEPDVDVENLSFIIHRFDDEK